MRKRSDERGRLPAVARPGTGRRPDVSTPPHAPTRPDVPARPDRLTRRHQRTRDEILDAAAALVTESGVDALNLTDLATRAGFGNAASLYRYFASKNEILLALARRGIERLGAHMARVPRDLPPAEQLVELCLAYLDYAAAHPAERRLLLSTAAAMAPDDRAAILPEEFVERMFGLVRAAVEEGSMVAHDDEDLFAILHAGWALAQGMAEYGTLYGEPERLMLRARHRAVFRAYVQGFSREWSEA